MSEDRKLKVFGGPTYGMDDLLKMDEHLLRALLRERIHHNIEVPFYSLLAKGVEKAIPSFGSDAQLVYDVWLERKLNTQDPDIKWAAEYIALAEKVRAGGGIEWKVPVTDPFTAAEMATVEKLLAQRVSVRDWIDKPVPDEMIEKILEAGRAAPIGCNLDEVRFVVIKDPEEAKMVWSDISTKNAVIIVICVDTRIPKVAAQDKFIPQNPGYDAAAAADHMLLMAHALGLGACWLSKTVASDVTKDTGKQFKELYGLPDYIEVCMHIGVGWTAVGSIKSQRMPLSEMILTRPK